MVHNQDLQVHNHDQRSAAPEFQGARPGFHGAPPGPTQCGIQDPPSGPAELLLATSNSKVTQPRSQGAQPGSTQYDLRRQRSLCRSLQILVQSGQPEPFIADQFASACSEAKPHIAWIRRRVHVSRPVWEDTRPQHEG